MLPVGQTERRVATTNISFPDRRTGYRGANQPNNPTNQTTNYPANPANQPNNQANYPTNKQTNPAKPNPANTPANANNNARDKKFADAPLPFPQVPTWQQSGSIPVGSAAEAAAFKVLADEAKARPKNRRVSDKAITFPERRVVNIGYQGNTGRTGQNGPAYGRDSPYYAGSNNPGYAGQTGGPSHGPAPSSGPGPAPAPAPAFPGQAVPAPIYGPAAAPANQPKAAFSTYTGQNTPNTPDASSPYNKTGYGGPNRRVSTVPISFENRRK